VDRGRVKHLHYITPMTNLASIMEHGILSHKRAAVLNSHSIADEAVQDRRADKRVPGGLMLHDYVNMFFDARNSMMYRRLNHKLSLAVICIWPSVLDIESTVVTDGNAASPSTTFFPSPAGLDALDENFIYAESWDHSDPWEKHERKRRRSAEALVPHVVPPGYVMGCYVYSDAATAKCNELCSTIKVKVNRNVFFA
jgi:hypothetical protein